MSPDATAVAQSVGNSTLPVPNKSGLFTSDLAAQMKAASEQNGVDFSPKVPWHIKYSYEQYDEDGDNVHGGAIEEFYAGPKRYKRIFTSDTLKQIDFGTDAGLFREGDQRWENAVELQVEEETLDPFYRVDPNQRNTRLDALDWAIGANKYPCVIVRRTDMTVSDNGLPKFCFDPDTTRIRYTRGNGWDETVFNKIRLFQGRNVPQEVAITHGGKAFLKIQIETLEQYPEATDATFAPTSNSLLIGGRIEISSAILMDRNLIERASASVPSGSKGKVRVRFVVGKDGHVVQADVLDGPEQMRKGVLAAIRKYTFKPFRVLGEPVEVQSETFVEFW